MENMEHNSLKVGQRIYDLRVEHDVQQGELSRAIGLHQSVLNRIEKGIRPARDTELAAISRYFGVCTDYLLGLTQQKKSSRHNGAASVTHLTRQWELNDIEAKLIDTFRMLDERGRNAVIDTATREYDYAFPKEETVSS